ncbi:hypothetical protein [Allosediminivita pacifica]|uniref:Permease n=1 Tax=Allosediminivita pacifica TaxID=1267769 RepID=A0A2T6ACL2_9RHOB|nr:hypothetical protein [Allosediminivita pacifica]PTX41540.1 hypothetical protein C8N44_12824 [Allosediminivita pacifica]GGB23120.1 hypothetical protein GCM10011324_36480 [Allosediminivita pacifica]
MNILIGTLLIGGVAVWLYLGLPNSEWRRAAWLSTWEMVRFTAPRMVVALLGAGFFAELLPREHVEVLFGADARVTGALLAAGMGPLTPGGAFVSFAIGAAALKAGAAPVAVLSYVSSWSLFSLTKILAYESPLLGKRAVLLRVAVSWPVPLAIAALGGLLSA